MAQYKNAEKHIRKTERRTVINHQRIARIRTFVRKVEEAISGGESAAALAALRVAESEIMRGASAGVLPQKRGSRKVSRLTQRVQAMGKAAS